MAYYYFDAIRIQSLRPVERLLEFRSGRICFELLDVAHRSFLRGTLPTLKAQSDTKVHTEGSLGKCVIIH